MAVYKVIQDIEAEDRLLGPLTLKGLVYAGIAGVLGFLNFRLLVSGIGPMKWAIIFALLFPMLLFAVLASPLGRDQPTEVWLLSRVRFFLKPRLRIWDQAGISDLVTITAPKRIARQLTKDFTQGEVDSRLKALALTLDSRGWAVKNVNVNLTNNTNYFDSEQESDRLIDSTSVVKEVPEINVHPADDILDAKSNPTAQKMQSLIDQAEVDRKKQLEQKLKEAKANKTVKKDEFLEKHPHPEKIHDFRSTHNLEDKAKSKLPNEHWEKQDNRVTEAAQAAKLELAQSGNGLSVASIAKLANRGNDGEVVIALH